MTSLPLDICPYCSDYDAPFFIKVVWVRFLKKWILDMFNSKKILDPAWLPAYEENIRTIANQMQRLNTNLFVLEKIVGFDFEFFSVIDKTFWIVVSQALYESSVMCAWRIAVDSGKDCLTISRLKNAVLKHIVLPDMRKLLKKELQKTALSRKIGDIKSRIACLRHTLFAHFIRFLEGPSKPATLAVTLQELKVVRDEINECVSVLSL
ncbi:MAG: hypothetical protein P8123_09170, partial [bacterium]